MTIEQIYTGCLSQGTYYIHSNGEAAIIDPLREVQPYIDRAKRDGVEIKYIFETHFHADFVSGHLTLAEKTGATIVYGPNANPKFDALIAHDNQAFKLGDVSIVALHTPGHTMESTTYLLNDEEGNPHAIFTGDTLFLGDVGRPDLAQKANEITQEDLAGILYDSLRNKIMPLPDHVIVYPAHGAGSACGKHMMKETVDTLGNQKAMNYALRADMTKEEFIKEVTNGLEIPPAYFPLNVKLNREGYESFDNVLAKGLKGLNPTAFEIAANQAGVVILDVRHQDEFKKAHVPNSIFIGLNGAFAPWVGALIKDIYQPILLVTPEGKEEEAVTRLSRVGFDNTLGFLEGGIEAWKRANKVCESIQEISAAELAIIYPNVKGAIYDVRKSSEYVNGHIKHAQLTPLDEINMHLAGFQKEGNAYMHCAGGYRSVIAISILQARGIHNLIDVIGGYDSIKTTDIPKAKGIETTTA